ncbi:MAG TPA: hypothetical protein VG146_04200 [Verrucomicrobiae bacterium]|nr:hypothetical protein [Verrucomicrobiae bacterium]
MTGGEEMNRLNCSTAEGAAVEISSALAFARKANPPVRTARTRHPWTTAKGRSDWLPTDGTCVTGLGNRPVAGTPVHICPSVA